MDELFGRNTADRVAEGHRGIRGYQQGSWPCAAAVAPRMHAFERRGAATDKRPRPNPNSSTTSDRQFVMASVGESTMTATPAAGTALLSRRCGCAGGPTSTPSYTAASDNNVPSAENPRPSRVRTLKISVHTPLLIATRLRLKSIRARQLQGRHSVWFRHRYPRLMAYPSDRSGNRVLVGARHPARAHARLCRTDRPHPALVFL